MTFLPTSVKEMKALGWEQADVILFTGDAYVDHPAFGAAVIGRVLEGEGYKVAIVPQPNWRDDLRDFKKLGEPRLFFAVTAGNMDSMVNHYTAAKRLRHDDAYTPEGKAGFRPDYATIIYSNILKKLFTNIPIIIGGVEASLRRFTHYDYWSDRLMPSILIDSLADVLVYGMGERPILEIAKNIDQGKTIESLRSIKQVAFIDDNIGKYKRSQNSIILHSFEECKSDKYKFAANFRVIEEESNRINSNKILIEPYGERCIVVNPPYSPTLAEEIDKWYDLPYTRLPHPRYKGKPISAWEMIKLSVNIHRGCFGACSFCTISAHQGRFISSRSEKSILNEIKQIKAMPEFNGYISDLGGPSANMYGMTPKNPSICEKCKRHSCIYPNICKNLNSSHEQLNQLYKKVREAKGIKKATIGSGIRYDLFLDRDSKPEKEYFENLIHFHVSGRLKVAPEHTSERVLKIMRKPSFELFIKLKAWFDQLNEKYGLKQQLIPYFISSHPGTTEKEMRQLVEETRKLNFKLEQVQDFTPTPMTLASTIYYTGINPYTGEEVYVARSIEEKRKQQSYFFWYKGDSITHKKTKQKKRLPNRKPPKKN